MAEEKKFREVKGAALWLPEAKDEMVEGKVIKVNPAGKYGFSATILTTEGKETLLPSHKMLQSLMEGVKDIKDKYVRITYLGEKASDKGNDTKLYKLEVAD